MLDFEGRMLSGEPFTMEELKHAFSKSGSEARKIERAVRDFHRRGLIKPQRQQLRVVWIATTVGMTKLTDRPR